MLKIHIFTQLFPNKKYSFHTHKDQEYTKVFQKHYFWCYSLWYTCLSFYRWVKNHKSSLFIHKYMLVHLCTKKRSETSINVTWHDTITKKRIVMLSKKYQKCLFKMIVMDNGNCVDVYMLLCEGWISDGCFSSKVRTNWRSFWNKW